MIRKWYVLAALSVAAAIALTGCVPISPDLGAGTVPAPADGAEQGSAAANATPTSLVQIGGPVATVSTRSLRVRELPTADSAQLGSVLSGESYDVTARSSDGMWLELQIPALGGPGWVAANLVTLSGDITDLRIVQVPTPAAPTAVPPTATLVPAELPTATPLPSEPPTEAVTETVAAPEAAEPTAAPVEAPTDAPAEPVTETVSVTETVAPAEPTVAPAELTPTPTFAPVVPPPAGFAAVASELRLRVRAEPSTEAEIVGYAYPGEVFQVIERTEDGAWTLIAGSAESRENPAGGWVSSEFLLFGQ